MNKKWLLGLPLVWMVIFFFAPISILACYSFLTRGTYGGIDWIFTIENYTRLFSNLYFQVILNSLFLSFKTTLVCILFGVPIAFSIVLASRKVRPLLIFLVVLPFLSNFLIRTYAIKNMLSENGLLRFFWNALDKLLLVDMIQYFHSGSFAVQIGMFTNYLPLMVLPLFVGFEKFDFTLIEAAKDLGSSSMGAFFKVFIPNVKSTIITSALMVFIPCLGEFVIPDLLGGAQVQTIGKLISEQFLKVRDWPFGSSLAILMLFLLIIPILIENSKKTL